MWIIHAPTYQPNSYGVRILYFLAELLRQNGREVGILPFDRKEQDFDNLVPDKYRGFVWEGKPSPFDIVVYPETVTKI